MSTDPLAAAEELLEAVQAEPGRVAVDAVALLERLERFARAGDAVESEASVVARFALGRAHHENGAIDDACTILADAAERAEQLGHVAWRGRILGSLALSQTAHDRPEEAEATLAVAEGLLDGADRARVTMQRAIMAVHAGKLEEGRRAFDEALGPLVDAGDRLAVARLHLSRGVAHSFLGDHAAADADYLAGGELAAELGQATLAASAHANLAFSRGRSGDLAGALESFETARAAYGEAGDPRRYVAALEADRCDVLLVAGLHREAIEAAERALELASDGENRVQEAEALLLLARARHAAGRRRGAVEAATEAAARFAAAGRQAWAAQAEFVAVAADGTGDVDAVDRLGRLAEQLEANGWELEALEVRTMLGMVLVDAGRLDEGRRELDRAAAGRHAGTVEQRSRSWYASALERRASGDHTGAVEAAAAGLDLLDRHRLLLGATELRLRVAHHRRALADLALELATAGSTAWAVLVAADRRREGAGALPPVRPVDDPELAGLVSEHRRLTSQLRQSLGEGEAGTGAPAETAALVAENEARLRSVLLRSRTASAAAFEPSPIAVDDEATSSLADRLGHRLLVHHHEVAGRIGVVAVRRDPATGHERVRRMDLGPVDELARRVDGLFFGLRRVTARFGSAAGLRSTLAGLEADVGWLRAFLVDPVLSEFTAAGELPELVVVPSDTITELPWQAILSRAAPVTVTPSLRLWLRPAAAGAGAADLASVADGRRPSMTALAGPGLPAAGAEVATLGERTGARVLKGKRAGVTAALAALAENDCVHIAAHGEFRADNPLFSALHLADGPLAVHDIERLPRVAPLVVLSACHAGRGAIGIPGEVLGTSHALLQAGARTVVAPVLPVADAVVSRLMLDLHDRLHAGSRAPEALAAVVDRAAREDPMTAWTARLLTVQGCDDLAG